MDYSKEQLEAMRATQLKELCKQHGIPHYRGKNCFKKDELVEAILRAEKVAEDGNASATDENKTDDHNGVEAAANGEGAANAGINMEQKMRYIEQAAIGTIVAFRLPNGKVKSAKIIKRSTKNKRFMVETNYGAQFVIAYTDVVWVRTGSRWPRGVYKLLKGMVEDGAEA